MLVSRARARARACCMSSEVENLSINTAHGYDTPRWILERAGLFAYYGG
jgi:hypothetical protein